MIDNGFPPLRAWVTSPEHEGGRMYRFLHRSPQTVANYMDNGWWHFMAGIGIKDVEYRDIYPEDIVEAHYTPLGVTIRGIVKFDEEKARYHVLHSTEDGIVASGFDALEDVRVLGNLFENPDLLESPSK